MKLNEVDYALVKVGKSHMDKRFKARLKDRNYSVSLLVITFGFLLLVAIFNFIVDPYWIWRKKPWVVRDSASFSHLINQQRSIKAIQFLMQQPKYVILGSSRAYHVFDIHHIQNAVQWYNMGISSLMLIEAYGYIKEMVLHGNVQKIYLGLNVFSFANDKPLAGYNNQITQRTYPFYAIVSSLIGKSATEDSITQLFFFREKRALMRYGKRNYYPGHFNYSGYQYTTKRPPWLVKSGGKRLHFEAKRDLKSLASARLLSKNLTLLERILRLTRKNHIRLILYFTPVSSTMLNWYQSASSFYRWKNRLIKFAAENNIPLYDFLGPNLVTQSKYQSRQEILQNKYILDDSHVSAIVGDYMLSCFGIKLKYKVNVPAGFCHKVN